MYSFFGGGNTLDTNTIARSPESISTICQYPIGKLRNDMGYQEYIRYQNDWNFFNYVWSYNYTVSTLRSTTGTDIQAFTFPDNRTAISYSNGQAAHAAFYPSSQSVFANISLG